MLPLEECSACHFHFAREPGYYFGVVTPILPILSIMTGAVFSGVSYFIFKAGIDTILFFGAVGIGLGFVGFFRTAIALYIALDHAIAPPDRDK